MSAPVFKYGLLCDEVRREDNGKLIMIGIYAGSIITSKIPARLGLSGVLCWESEGPAKVDMAIQFLLDDKLIAQGEGQYEIDSPGRSIMALPRMPLNVASEGLLKFQIKPQGEDWQDAISLPVRKKPA